MLRPMPLFPAAAASMQPRELNTEEMRGTGDGDIEAPSRVARAKDGIDRVRTA
jgi:hypothetical protein